VVKSLLQKLRLSTFAPFLTLVVLAKLAIHVSNFYKNHALLAQLNLSPNFSGFSKLTWSNKPLRQINIQSVAPGMSWFLPEYHFNQFCSHHFLQTELDHFSGNLPRNGTKLGKMVAIFCSKLCPDTSFHVQTDLPAYNKHLYTMPAASSQQSFSLPFAFQANKF